MHLEISPRVMAVVVVVALMIVGGIFYRTLAGPSPEAVDRDVQAVQQKMQLKLPGQPNAQQPPTTPPPTKP